MADDFSAAKTAPSIRRCCRCLCKSGNSRLSGKMKEITRVYYQKGSRKAHKTNHGGSFSSLVGKKKMTRTTDDAAKGLGKTSNTKRMITSCLTSKAFGIALHQLIDLYIRRWYGIDLCGLNPYLSTYNVYDVSRNSVQFRAHYLEGKFWPSTQKHKGAVSTIKRV